MNTQNLETLAPKRIQLSRAKGWRKPEGAILVARPSRWGNPIVVGDQCEVRAVARDGVEYPTVPMLVTHEIAVAIYRAEIEARLTPAIVCGSEHPEDTCARLEFEDELMKLRGHDLACWCPLVDSEGRPVPCHADVLLEFANR